jgi:hypothetical protein
MPAFLDKGRLRPALEPVHVAVALCFGHGHARRHRAGRDMLA